MHRYLKTFAKLLNSREKKNETHIASILHSILISENGILYFEPDQLR